MFLVLVSSEYFYGAAQIEGHLFARMVDNEFVAEFAVFELVDFGFADDLVGVRVVEPTALRNDVFDLVGCGEEFG